MPGFRYRYAAAYQASWFNFKFCVFSRGLQLRVVIRTWTWTWNILKETWKESKPKLFWTPSHAGSPGSLAGPPLANGIPSQLEYLPEYPFKLNSYMFSQYSSYTRIHVWNHDSWKAVYKIHSYHDESVNKFISSIHIEIHDQKKKVNLHCKTIYLNSYSWIYQWIHALEFIKLCMNSCLWIHSSIQCYDCYEGFCEIVSKFL